MAHYSDFPIREWSASYYGNDDRTWYYGLLHMNAAGVSFIEGYSKSPVPLLLHLKYTDIVEVKKTTTGLIFGALVLVTNTGLKHWISSLADRSSVFNALCYFKRCQVLPSVSKSAPVNTGGKTEMGKKLLNVAYDSQNTLNEAATMLKYQGDQLDSAALTMTDIHGDLDIADNLISGLEKWFGKWTIPEEYRHIEPMIVKKDDLSQDMEYEVLYTKLETSKLNNQNLGILRICHEGLYILTEKQKMVHHFKWTDISKVKVVSLWEIVVTRFLIGQPDLSFSIVFSTLFSVLKILEQRLRSKVEYSQDAFKQMAEPVPLKGSKLSPAEEKNQLGSYKWRQDRQDGEILSTEGRSFETGGKNQSTIGIQKSKEVVTEQEATELSGVLSDLTSLALEAQREMDVQNEKIDKLSGTVQDANDRLKDTENRVKKLL
ncbi:hypothetical protein FSP39_014188 [Pinctada imbricata]|uniref:t-SNARE coiled-coil homology domain-containing protein n=1 Tax=Pinctada imbricata TaxID=66713 RepID=A0AA88YK47_PINIB|nr:hypothetical protein FSP39_014188 [Pinctada imbricata]